MLKKTKKVYFVQKPDSTKSTLFIPLGTSQRASQPSREHARFKETNFGFFFWDGLILCVTLYTTKPCGFLQPRRSFLSVSYSKTDTNNNYP